MLSESFHSLQTGKHIQSNSSVRIREPFIECFHSLQTGKHIQSVPYRLTLSCYTPFPFPSNGKAYPKHVSLHLLPTIVNVSIPFKRESISKVKGRILVFTARSFGFNSLQTGKHIQSETTPLEQDETRASFNSLQTGKHIQSK